MGILNRIFPVPQQIERLPGAALLLGRPGQSCCYLDADDLPADTLTAGAIRMLDHHLQTFLKNVNAYAADSIPIRLRLGPAPAGVKNPDQGYALTVHPDSVEILGFGLPGLFYGAVTFCQCLSLEDGIWRLPQMRILDWPDMAVRGHTLECRYGSDLMRLADWQALIDYLAGQKINQLEIAIYGCWCVQYGGKISEYLYVPLRRYPELQTPVSIRYYSPAGSSWVEDEVVPPMFSEDFFGQLIQYGRSRGVKIFPMFNSFGHNTLIPRLHPEISAVDTAGRPSGKSLCVSNPRTYDVFFNIYDEIIDRYLLPNGIDSFCIGLDEVHAYNGQDTADLFKKWDPWCKCTICAKDQEKDLFIWHAVRLIAHLKNRGMKQVYIYQDMLLEMGGSDTLGQALKDAGLDDVVVIDWWSYADIRERQMYQTTRPDLGLRRTVKPWNGYFHWTVLTHPLANIAHLAEIAWRENAEGMLCYSSWDMSYDRNMACLAGFCWNYAGTGDPERLTDQYVHQHFQARYDLVRQAFSLIDQMTAHSNQRYQEPNPVIGSWYGLWIAEKLAYYNYTYVQDGRPYPRIFPGEALEILNKDRDIFLPELENIAGQAEDALDLLTEAAEDPRINTALARRYAYEMENYLVLAEDYLTLFQMIDLAADPANFPMIGSLAEGRKQARLRVMSLLEKVKEPFLLASQMRNHSIFLQFFADLAAYIERTGPDQVHLDFFDMRYLASEAFWRLR